ncbi:MAG: hypothetical protein IJV70_01255, partial [Clostridia bacterium]|nr:hypothetical protein [Clostridia bacterium]
FFPKKEERKGSKERRKKRVRSFPENSLKSRSEFWVQKLPQRSAEYFGLFEEKFRLCRKEIFDGDTSRCSHKVHGITVRSFLQKYSQNARIFGLFGVKICVSFVVCGRGGSAYRKIKIRLRLLFVTRKRIFNKSNLK